MFVVCKFPGKINYISIPSSYSAYTSYTLKHVRFK